MDFKILNREKVYQSRAFGVQKVHLELPNAKKQSYDLVDHNRLGHYCSCRPGW